MSPERLMNKGYGPSSDVWSLGICLFCFLMGISPFPKARTFWNIVDAMMEERQQMLPVDRYSRYLRDFVCQCLILDPTKRPSASLLLIHPFMLQVSQPTANLPVCRDIVNHTDHDFFSFSTSKLLFCLFCLA